MRALSAGLLVLLGAGAPQDPERLPTAVDKILRPDHAPGEFLVRYRPGLAPAARDAVRARAGAALARVLGGRKGSPLHLLRFPPGSDETAALKKLAADPAVLYAEPNYRWRKLDTLPNDPRFGELWGLRNTGQSGGTPGADLSAPSAWDLSTGAATKVVAVLDTGLDYTHPDLAANVWINPAEIPADGLDNDGNGFVDDLRGWDFAGDGASPAEGAQDSDPIDDDGHGTHVAGTIGAVGNNGIGVAGVAWTVRLMALRFLSPSGGWTSDAVAAYDYVATMKLRGVDIVAVNNSWGGGPFSQALLDAIEEARGLGILSVCASGNDGLNNDEVPHFPAGYDTPGVISVGASNRFEQVPVFSNFGVETVDLFAPGVAVLSTYPTYLTSSVGTPGYDVLNGTSMAAPHVSGAVALLAARFPGIGPAEARARLLYNVDARDGYAGRCLTRGRLNVRRALEDVDATAPGAPDGLSAPGDQVSYSAARLQWTASGDDGPAGRASAYEVRYSTSPISEATFASAARAEAPPLPLDAGTSQSMRVCGLDSSTTYYFAIRAYDNVGNASPLSAVVSARTRAESTATVVFQDDFSGAGSAFDAARWVEQPATSAWARRNDGGSLRASDSAGNYGDNLDISLRTARIDLSGFVDATLSFQHRYDFELGFDFGFIHVSTDGGTTWRWLSQYTSTRAAYAAVERVCLADYDGLPDVRIRFRVVTDGSVVADGWHIDDVRVLARTLPLNTAPTAAPKTVSTPEDVAAAITLTGSDPEGDPLSFAVATGPSHGVLTGTPPSLTYTPGPDFNGADSFTVTASDGFLTGAAAVVSITVTPANDAPAATPQALSTAEDTPLGITLAGTDVDGDAPTFAVLSGPSHGTLSGTAPNLTYTPAANYAGPDAFTFRANDGALNSTSATVSLTVTPVNDPPAALAQSRSTSEDVALPITLGGSDLEGDGLSFAIVSGPAQGTLSGTPPDLTYTPGPDFNGADSFSFRANDGALDSAPATVSITVTPVNDAPAATPQALSTAEEAPLPVTLAGVDLEADPLTFAVVSPPAHGTLSGTPPNLTYTPAPDYHGADAFTFRANDGALSSAPASISLTVTPVADPPAGSPIVTVVDNGGTLSITLSASDPDGDPLSFQVTGAPSNGTLSGSAPNLTYTPNPGFSGPDSLTFTVGDGTFTSAPTTATFTVPAPPATGGGGGGGGGGGCGSFGFDAMSPLALLFLLRRLRRS